MVLIEDIGMSTTSASTVKDQELMSVGLVESASVKAFADFIPSNLNESLEITQIDLKKEKEDFINSFICHLIFYAFFCFSIFLHIIIDLGFGSFVKKKFIYLIGLGKKNVLEKSPAFA